MKYGRKKEKQAWSESFYFSFFKLSRANSDYDKMVSANLAKCDSYSGVELFQLELVHI